MFSGRVLKREAGPSRTARRMRNSILGSEIPRRATGASALVQYMVGTAFTMTVCQQSFQLLVVGECTSEVLSQCVFSSGYDNQSTNRNDDNAGFEVS